MIFYEKLWDWVAIDVFNGIMILLKLLILEMTLA